MIVTVSFPLYDNTGHLLGVIGTDMALLYILEEYESPLLKTTSSYAYVTNYNEEILAHPAIPCSGRESENLPVHVNVKNLETENGDIIKR